MWYSASFCYLSEMGWIICKQLISSLTYTCVCVCAYIMYHISLIYYLSFINYYMIFTDHPERLRLSWYFKHLFIVLFDVWMILLYQGLTGIQNFLLNGSVTSICVLYERQPYSLLMSHVEQHHIMLQGISAFKAD